MRATWTDFSVSSVSRWRERGGDRASAAYLGRRWHIAASLKIGQVDGCLFWLAMAVEESGHVRLSTLAGRRAAQNGLDGAFLDQQDEGRGAEP